MKREFLISFVGIICLSGCMPSKSSLEQQTKTDSLGLESGDVRTKPSIEDNNNKVSESSNSPEEKASSTKPNVIAETKSSAEALGVDKDISDLAQKLRDSRIDTLPDSLVICTVNGDPITVGDYRHQFKIEQEQIQASLATNPQVANNLIKEAQDRNVTLSFEEKKHLAGSATKMEAGGSKGFNKMLAESNMTKNQFRDQVLDVGLAFKMAGKLIEEGLLTELINRKKLVLAAKQNGFSKEALNKYTDVSKSDQYKRLIQVSGLSPEEMREDIINNELCVRQIDKIKKDSPISDADIANYYEKNRGKFRHGPRIRLSQIFIARTRDIAQTPAGFEAKLIKENPKLSKAEIEKQITDFERQQADIAKDVLARAQKGEDFATLANQYSDKAIKTNGGDVGFQDEDKLEKNFAEKVIKLPVGGVTTEVIVSPYGFHIFKVTAKENKGFYALSEIRSSLEQMLAQDKGQQNVEDWLTNARKAFTVAISPEMKQLVASNKMQKRAL